MPAPAVIPALIAYIKIAAVKKLVVSFRLRLLLGETLVVGSSGVGTSALN